MEKIRLVIYRVNENLMIDDMITDRSGGGGEGGNAHAAASQTEQVNELLIQMQHMKIEVMNMQSSIEQQVGNFRVFTSNQFHVVNNNIRRFGGTIQGAVARQNRREARRTEQQQQAQAAAQLQ